MDLLSTLLSNIYSPGGARRPWKDQLSDWLLDRYVSQGSLNARDLLDGLFLFRPALLEVLRKQSDLQADLAAVLTPAQDAGHQSATPDSTRSMA
jgi:hypothetical protein